MTDNKPFGDAANVCREMAARLELNKDDLFGGAFVLFPPQGEAIVHLSLNGHTSKAEFFAFLKSQIDQVCSLIAQQEQEDRAFGRR